MPSRHHAALSRLLIRSLAVCGLALCGLVPAPSAAAVPAPPVLAQVGDWRIDARQLHDAARQLLGEDAVAEGLTAARRDEVLEALIDARLLALEAESRGLGDSEAVRNAVMSAERDAIEEITRRQQVEARIEITEEEIRDRYRIWGEGEVIEPAHILLSTRAGADSVLAELQAGADFDQLASERSIHGGSSLRGGSMGYLRKFLIPGPLRAAIWDLEAGEVYPEPVPTSMGFHVLKVLRRGHQELAEQESAIRGFLTRKERAILERDLYERLFSTHDYHYRADAVAGFIRQGPSVSGDSVMASWRGGALTIADYRDRAPKMTASTTDTTQVRKLVDDLAAAELMRIEGRAAGLHESTHVRRRVEEARIRTLSHALFADVAEHQDPTEAQIQAYYEGHRESYRGSRRLTVREILVDDAATADSLYHWIRAGQDMAALARQYSQRQATREAGGLWEDVPRYERESATVYRVAMDGEDLLPPVSLPSGGWSVIRVVSKDAGELLPLEEVEGAIREDLLTVAMDELIQRLRRELAGQVQRYADKSR